MASASLNKVFLLGRLGTAPEMRSTANQLSVTTFSLATTETRGSSGQRQEYTEWHRIVAWGKTAEICNQYLTKGSPVFIEGRLQTRSWDDKNGVKRYTTEIIASNIQFLPRSTAQTSTTTSYAQQSVDSGVGSSESFDNSTLSDIGLEPINSEELSDIPF